MSDNNRYSRQISLPEIGQHGQARIRAASVLSVGAGGLGCPALLYLAAAGVGRIGIIDFDTVEQSNLHRQILFTADDIGQNKAEIAAKRIRAQNPDCEIIAYPHALDTDNVLDLFGQYDIVLDGTDNFATKYLINDAAVKTGTPFIYASLQGFGGQIGVFNAQNESKSGGNESGACYRCLYPEPPREHIPTCAQGGMIGAVAGTIGVLQAVEALKIIANHPNLQPLYGRILHFDIGAMRPRILDVPKDKHCTVCSRKRNEITLPPASDKACATQQPHQGNTNMIENISAEEAQQDTSALLIDVRELEEWENGHAQNAIHIPLSLLMNGADVELPQDQDIILYCQKGMRSLYAAQILQSKGYSRLKNVTGGFDDWPPE